MRVTKIIREHVERVVGSKYNADIKAIPIPDPVEISDEYKEWAEEYIKEIIATCKQKREEFGINTHNAETIIGHYGYYDYDDHLERSIKSIIPTARYLRDTAKEEYDEKITALRKERNNKIEDILVGLEMGSVRKNELDDLLAEYK